MKPGPKRQVNRSYKLTGEAFSARLLTREFVVKPVEGGVAIAARDGEHLGTFYGIDEVASIRNYLTYHLNTLREQRRKAENA